VLRHGTRRRRHERAGSRSILSRRIRRVASHFGCRCRLQSARALRHVTRVCAASATERAEQ
jgi:hypothetical protein